MPEFSGFQVTFQVDGEVNPEIIRDSVFVSARVGDESVVIHLEDGYKFQM